MKKCRFISLLLAVALMLSVTACGNPSGTTPASTDKSDEKTYVIKVANQWADTSVHTKFITEKFIPRVEELTNKRVKVEFYGNNSLGNEFNQVEQTQMGKLNMCVISEQSASLNPAMLNAMMLPYLFEDEAHWDKVVNGEIGKKFGASLPAKGLRVLGFTENGLRVITNSKRPINSVADLKGLKIRVSSSEMSIALFEALETNTVATTIGEVFSALQTNTFDGQENPYNTIRSFRFNEVQKYLAETNHVLNTMYFVASEQWLTSLPEDIRGAVEQAAKEACQYQVKMLREAAAADKKFLLENGMTATTPDVAEFKKAAEAVYEKYYQKYPDGKDLVEEIKAAAK
ncbi:TRAP transporter substrate-binding protein [Desulfosporosinus fructosivorans]|nr:TRAP transporter substrate-binding protein [Desulfosporosinus fructosivorans]